METWLLRLSSMFIAEGSCSCSCSRLLHQLLLLSFFLSSCTSYSSFCLPATFHLNFASSSVPWLLLLPSTGSLPFSFIFICTFNNTCNKKVKLHCSQTLQCFCSSQTIWYQNILFLKHFKLFWYLKIQHKGVLQESWIKYTIKL